MKFKTITKYSFFGISFALPSLAFAAGRNIRGIAYSFARLLGKPLMTLLFTLALVMFLWGLVQFMSNAEKPDEREKGKERMIWGIIALFVMVSFLALVAVFTGTFFGSANPLLPQFFDNQ